MFSKILAENFPNFGKKRVIQVQEVFRTPNGQDQRENTPGHIIVKTLSIQNKERILNSAREKSQVHINANPSE
jgi:hypothetical protein